jgi:hypothetical protein
MMFSYFPYAAAFRTDEAGTVQIDMGLVGIGLAIAPFVFITVAFLSRNPEAPRRVMYALALTIPIGLAVGLLVPPLGATAAFGIGGALCLRPLPIGTPYRWRIWAVLFMILYTLVLFLFLPPIAGVFAGGLLPLLMVGFADEYSMWRKTRDAQAEA